jgi:hypothetical protein
MMRGDPALFLMRRKPSPLAPILTARERLQPPGFERDLLPLLQDGAREARPLL